jgi:DNA-3-methyladenine glycosylase
VGRQLTAPPGLLPREFFGRPVLEVAQDLLGCVLRHETADGPVAVTISEVEAYLGAADPASHAFRGMTARNAVMFGEPGHAYVYFTYGMHFCVNLVCLPPGTAGAVLLRAGRVTEGEPLAAARRAAGRADGPLTAAVRRDLARGPARLCRALAIDRAQDGADVCGAGSPLQILAPAAPVPPAAISRGPRVGIRRATEEPWRFWITGDPAVSVFRPHVPRRRT